MTFQEAVERLSAAMRQNDKLWININTSDLAAFTAAVEVALEEMEYAVVSLDQLNNIISFLSGSYIPMSEDELQIFQELAEKQVYVIPFRDEKQVATNTVIQFYLANINKKVISFGLNMDADVKENVIDINIPFLTGKYAPKTVFNAIVAMYGDEKQARESYLVKHGIKVMEPLETWTLGGWDIFKKDMEIFAEYKRKEADLDTEIILKGVMLIGIPGTGKSLAAKIVGRYFNWPVIQFNFSSVLSKWVGESEKLMDQFIEVIEGVAPVVVYMDEIEKLLHTSSGDPVTPRIIGSLLSWMQDTPKDVYIVATANAVFGSHFTAPLPPELMRRGRFDELYFADIPPLEEKLEILEVFFRRYHIPAEVKDIDKDTFRKLADKFTGAEIEDAVKKAFIHFTVKGGDYFDHFYAALKETIPIAKTHGKYIMELRKFAMEKFKPVSSAQKEQLFSLLQPSSKLNLNIKR